LTAETETEIEVWLVGYSTLLDYQLENF